MRWTDNKLTARWIATAIFILHPSSFILLLTGCNVAGVVASAVPTYTKARYPGLAGQSVGVMVWADRGILIDWGTIQLDLANAVQTHLQSSTAEEVKGATFPVEPRSIIRYQRDHPGVEALPVTELAPHLGVSRLVYVEVTHFRTRSETQLELFRGTATARVKVVAVDATGGASVAFTEDTIQAVFPPSAPADGVPSLGDRNTYNGTVQVLAEEVARRFVTFEDDGR
jgi:hypothetical protein